MDVCGNGGLKSAVEVCGEPLTRANMPIWQCTKFVLSLTFIVEPQLLNDPIVIQSIYLHSKNTLKFVLYLCFKNVFQYTVGIYCSDSQPVFPIHLDYLKIIIYLQYIMYLCLSSHRPQSSTK